jgi:hypothetical protein
VRDGTTLARRDEALESTPWPLTRMWYTSGTNPPLGRERIGKERVNESD